MKITQDMVTVFNQKLKEIDCSFKLKFEENGLATGNTTCQIVPANNKFISSSIINMTDEFYEFLEKFFAERGIELTYNNDGSIFWSKSGWKDIVEELQKAE